MSLPESQQRELDELVSAVVDDQLPAEQAARLQHLLRDDAAAQQYYALAMSLHASLFNYAAEAVQATDGVERIDDPAAAGALLSPWHAAAQRVFQFVTRPTPFSLSAAAALIGVLLASMALIMMPSQETSRRRIAGESESLPLVARLTGMHEAKWSDGQTGKTLGAHLAAGHRLQLQAGFAEITFRAGAVVTLEGPCELTLSDAQTAELRRGKLAARVEEPATGFTIGTPATVVVDRGTEFGVLVESDGTTGVHVFQGKVELQSRGGNPTHFLTVGLSARALPDGSVTSTASNLRRQFVRQLPHFGQETSDEFVAYQVSLGAVGTQDFGGSFGLDFVVLRPIEVTRLGAFDSGADGLARTITSELWLRNDAGTPDNPADDRGREILAAQQFTAETPGGLAGSHRLLTLPQPLLLEPGAYTIVAHGYGSGELAANEPHNPALAPLKRRSDGRGAIAFVGASRWGTAGAFPGAVDQLHNPQQYAAGTFAYRVLDDPKNQRSSPNNPRP